MKDYFKDKRGWIRKFNFNGGRVNVIFTKKGAMRSGDYHKSAQYDLILTGKWKITMRKGRRNESMLKGPNTLVRIPPKTPHLYKCLADSFMIEWWDGPFEANYYWPYRKIIEKSLARGKRKSRSK